MNKGILITVGLLLAVVSTVFALQFLRFQNIDPLTPEQLQKYNTVLMGSPRQLKTVEMLDQNQVSFSISDFSGQWSLINFGYTHCPDVCPTNLLTLSKSRTRLEAEGKPVPQIYLATVDPERDTPEHMAEYIKFFDPNIKAIWANEKSMSDFARQLNNLFMKTPAKEDGSYLVDHSDNIAILNPNGEFVGIFRPPHRIEDISFVMANLMAK